MSNLLDPAALLATLPSLLPASSKRLSSPHDGIAALLHTVMSTLAFRLIAIDDSAPALSIPDNVLPAEWNNGGPNNYTFRYRHDQSSMVFLIKLLKLGQRTLINAIAIETDKAYSLDISTQDFTSQSFYPHDLSAPNVPPLVHGFISSNRITDLISQLQLKILQKLIPGLHKEGYTESADEVIIPGDTGSNRPRLNAPLPRPQIPRFDPNEEFPFRLPPANSPVRNPLEIGRRDREPLSANPFAPPPLFPLNNGNGMLVGPEHPIFGRNPVRGLGGRGPWGGDGFLPAMGAPPGARFDPVAPDIVPFSGPGRRLGPGNGRHIPGGNDPDNDEFFPPGMHDMFS